MSRAPIATAGDSAGVSADVFAAGALCWRIRAGRLEVLLVHRPKYDDWSWPKGKAESGETLPETAVREVAEETGYRVRLGLPLPPARYHVGVKKSKYVGYWAARVDSDEPVQPANLKEIDRTAWLAPDDARRTLSAHGDREQLDRLEHAHSTGTLYAWPFIIVRHGKAFPRSKWHETESVRPLLALGTTQAKALTGLLDCWPVNKIVSSPWKRCVATVKPFAAAVGKALKLSTPLSEKGNAEAPQKTRKMIEKILAKGRPTLICTHRPVLPTVLKALAGHAPAAVAEQLPHDDPYMSPGEVLVAYVRPQPVPRIVEIERFRPIDG